MRLERLCRRYSDGGAVPQDNEGTAANEEAKIEETAESGKPEKTFTQADVNRMMKAEKEKGRRSVLSDLGIEDVTNAKEALKAYQEYQNSQKTELQRATDELKAANDKAAIAEARAQKAEYCLKAIANYGANSVSADDLISIAITKVSDEKDIEAVLKEMKENSAYSGFFVNAENNKPKGTGSPIPPKSPASMPNGNGKNYGAMLAERQMERLKKYEKRR